MKLTIKLNNKLPVSDWWTNVGVRKKVPETKWWGGGIIILQLYKLHVQIQFVKVINSMME